MANILVFAKTPSLGELGAGYLIYREFNVEKVLVLKKDGVLMTRKGDFYYCIGGKVSGENVKVFECQDSFLLYKRIVDMVVERYEGTELEEKVWYASSYFERVLFNRSSEYSYLKILYAYHEKESKGGSEFATRMFKEFDKLWWFCEELWEEGKRFRQNENNKIEKVGTSLIAYYEGEANSVLYKYLFDLPVDFIVYNGKDGSGVIVNKVYDQDLLNGFRNRIEKKFGKELVARCDGIHLKLNELADAKAVYQELKTYIGRLK